MTHGDSISRSSAGFTLVELLVSLVILSMLSMLLLSGMVSAGVISSRAETGERIGAEVAAAQQTLRGRLTLLRPVVRLDSATPLVNAAGNDQAFDFYASPPAATAADGTQNYRLLLTAPGDLVLYHAGELNDVLDLQSPGVVGWQATRLIGGVTSLSIGYFGATHDEPERKWRAFWRDNSRAPELVRVRATFRAGDDRRWPDLIVRPASTLDVACDPEVSAAVCGKRP